MRKVDFAQWREQRSRVAQRIIRTESLFTGRVAGKRPRDPEMEHTLSELDKARRRRWLETGKLRRLGPRRYALRVDFDQS